MPATQDTFASMWERAVHEHGDRTFLVFSAADDERTEWSFREFDDAVARVTGVLQERGVRAGTAFHISLGNCPAFVALWLAAARLGAWFVAGDPRASESEIAAQLRRISPIVGFTGGEAGDATAAAATQAGVPVLVLDDAAMRLAPGSDLVDAAPVTSDVSGIEPRDRLAVMFTSGTTSQPKGVVLTQGLYAFTATTMAAAARVGPDDRWLVVLPLFHANAQYYCFASAIDAGASVALVSRFSASRWVAQARDLGATHASLFAAPIRMVLARDDSGAAADLKHLWFSQNLTAAEYAEIGRRTATLPRQLYGLTETGPGVLTERDDRPSADTLGTQTPGTRVRLEADDDPDTVGDEIVVGGVPGLTLFDGYLDDPDATARAVSAPDPDGISWFRTGDRGREDSDGRIRFLGRGGDVAKVGGENVSLSEVEAVLAEYPGIQEVIAVALADRFLDEVVAAVVVPPQGATDIDRDDFLAWSAARLSPSRRPRTVSVIREIPRTSVGKIRRFLVAEAVREGGHCE